MRDIYCAPHPAFLTYLACNAKGEPVAAPALAPARPLASDQRTESDGERTVARVGAATVALPLTERVRAVIAAMQKMSPEALSVDGDGDIGIRAGSAMVFVRVRDNPPLVDVFSPVLAEIEATEKLYGKLSDLSTRMPVGRLYWANRTVWASVPVFGRDFQPSHLMLAVQLMTGLADELDDRLQGEFGGRRFFGEGDRAAPRDDSAHTGMYL
jgi:hypothetical protein